MNVIIPVVDVIAFVAFALAFGLVMTVRSDADGPISGVAKMCMLGMLAVYVFAMGSNVLEHAGITAVLDPVEDSLEILFPPLGLYAAYALYVRQRERELLASQRVSQRSQEMVLGILDSTPAGIIVLDGSGRITFANQEAKAVLDLVEDEVGTFTTPGWLVHVAGGSGERDFSALLRAVHGHSGVPVAVEWPNGWRVDVSVRTEQLCDSAGRVGGMVATFLPPVGLHPEAGPRE